MMMTERLNRASIPSFPTSQHVEVRDKKCLVSALIQNTCITVLNTTTLCGWTLSLVYLLLHELYFMNLFLFYKCFHFTFTENAV